ncbi:MAG: serine O-acetyltransferase [Alphaproteobacteria bacterium]|nr:serine O-acetyltransferase [Alphaproteobacteria bacterium]
MEKRPMPVIAEKFAVCDPVWSDLREEAIRMAAAEPTLASFVHATILNHERLEAALTYHLAQKLGNDDVGAMQVRQVFDQAFNDEPTIGDEVRADLSAIYDRDPAVNSFVEPFLFFKGFQSLQAFRVTHWLWAKGRKALAFHFQSRISEVFGVDIHPAARIGRGVMIDHGTGVVIGETAVVEDDVSMLQGVTLGGTGKEQGDRHPKVRRGVMIGAGAKILGNLEIGAYSRVGAGSVVLKDVPERCTVAGVPAKVVGCAGCERPAQEMNQIIEDAPLDYQI